MFENGFNVSQFATVMQNKDMKFAEKILIFCKQPLKASYASFIPLVFKEKGRIRIFTLYPCDTRNDKNGH